MSLTKIIQIAQNEIGYLEKASNSQLDSKTANAGSNNYTKYGAWYDGGSLQAQPWCDMFVSWCADQAGESAAVGCYAYCPSHVNFFKNKGQYFARGAKTPQAGDIIFFTNSGSTASHVGIVEKVSGGAVYTIEGNTSGASTLVTNGGGVCEKSYSTSSTYILGYGRPSYSDSGSGGSSSSGSATTYDNVSGKVKLYGTAQKYQNGSTDEIVYQDSGKNTKIGYLDPYDSALCIGKYQGMYIIVYNVSGSSVCKIGFVEYAGGCTSATPTTKTYKNGSTEELVYYSTTFSTSTKVGSLNTWESCVCFGTVNGLYAVAYKVDGKSYYKVGLVEYAGGLS